MRKPNIVLIVIDTLRGDYSKILDPVFEKYGFKKYTNVIAPSSWTIPSHASMLTGLYPKDHGAHATKNIKVPNIKLKKIGKLLTLDLKKIGYTNYLYSANPYISPNFGFKFFDYIYEYDPYPQFLKLNASEILYLLKLKNEKIKNRRLYYLKTLYKKPSLFSKLFVRKYMPFLKKLTGWPYNKGITSITKKVYTTKFLKPFFVLMNLMKFMNPTLNQENLVYV